MERVRAGLKVGLSIDELQKISNPAKHLTKFQNHKSKAIWGGNKFRGFIFSSKAEQLMASPWEKVQVFLTNYYLGMSVH